ncbi:MAG: Crp/Fnr family transcriptional regulator [Anderseniella sp.]|jgi:CRP-like cAMP-binding protein|nr:Crp/Fnr family transcriptional regulator [Anderseniella sp.]
MDDVENLLERGWLSRQSADFTSAVLAKAEIRSLADGAPIYHVDDTAPLLCGIAEGAVILACPHPIYGLLDVHLKIASEWFGIFGLQHNAGRLFSAVARGSTRIVVLRRTAYLELRGRNSEFEEAFNSLHLSECQVILRSALDLLVQDYRARLISRILTLCLVDLEAPGRKPIQLPLTQRELAEMCNLSRKSVQSYLSDMEKDGLCKVGYRSLEITNPAALVQLMRTLAETD